MPVSAYWSVNGPRGGAQQRHSRTNPAAPSPAFGATTDRRSVALAERYRIERHLGVGGMATVYLAQAGGAR